MAFALWIDRDLAWAQGLHEYRPMGVAVIAVTDRFQPRDFRAARPAPPRLGGHYAGLFASLSDVNRRLARLRCSQQTGKAYSPAPAWLEISLSEPGTPRPRSRRFVLARPEPGCRSGSPSCP